jgi:peroxiredoxin
VPDDRFGDLGGPPAGSGDPGAPRTAAEKLADLDERRPEPDAGPPEPSRPSGRYMWVVGVAAIVLFTVVGIHQLRSGPGTFIEGPVAGRQLPEFAAPLVDGPKDKVASVIPRDANTDERKACEVRVPGSINICDQWSKPVVLSFLFLRGAKCEPRFDDLERLRREFPGVNFIGVFFEKDRDKVRDVVRRHDWHFPLAVDPDGAVTNLYAVGGCPTTVLAERGGRVRETLVGDLEHRALRRHVQALVR